MSNHNVLSGDRLMRVSGLLSALVCLLILPACGGSSSNNGGTTTSNLSHRAFISNTFSGALQIVDTQNDKTALTAQTTNSSGQVVPGVPVTIAVSTSVTFEAVTADRTKTMVYDPNSETLYFITNSSESVTSSFPLGNPTSMALFSPDGNTVYAPFTNLNTGQQRAGGVQVIDDVNLDVKATYSIPSATYLALSPSGQYLLVMANNSDSVFLLNLTASTVTPVEIPGFARPINAFFSSDSNTAYVLNCGPECGSSGPASVSSFNIPSQTITATVQVGGASVGLLNGTTLYVAGSPVPPGTTSTYDVVDVGSMTRTTTNSVAIGDGFHTTMALATNNKLYIGANSCSNTTTGCLSVVNVANNTADPPLPPRGAITALLSVSGRNVVYAIEGGYMNIYDTTTDTLQGTQIIFTGALNDIVQVDQ
jgi:hypothetical protein